MSEPDGSSIPKAANLSPLQQRARDSFSPTNKDLMEELIYQSREIAAARGAAEEAVKLGKLTNGRVTALERDRAEFHEHIAELQVDHLDRIATRKKLMLVPHLAIRLYGALGLGGIGILILVICHLIALVNGHGPQLQNIQDDLRAAGALK